MFHQNGARGQPPSILELHAARSKQPIYLSVVLMDGTVRKIEVDSASTAAEAIQQLSNSLRMTDTFGFSVFITLFDKAMSLGSDKEHLMDAISNCEQYMKEQGMSEKAIAWRLVLRKEIFTPWYDPGECPAATELIYKQIVAGVNSGEFRCKTEKEIAILGALVYYAEHGSRMDSGQLRALIPKCVPDELLRRTAGDQALAKWEKAIVNSFKASPKIAKCVPSAEAKADIVTFAQLSWTMLFSRFYEAVMFEGLDLPTKNLIIAVNSSGVFLLNEHEEVVVELSYPEILAVSRELGDHRVDTLIVSTVQKVEFGFKCFEAQVIVDLIEYMLTGLKRRSTYAVAIQNYVHPDNADGYLRLMKGDLVKLGHGFSGDNLNSHEFQWAYGESRGKEGDFPTEAVYVLPCIEPPHEDVLELFKVCLELDGVVVTELNYLFITENGSYYI